MLHVPYSGKSRLYLRGMMRIVIYYLYIVVCSSQYVEPSLRSLEIIQGLHYAFRLNSQYVAAYEGGQRIEYVVFSRY